MQRGEGWAVGIAGNFAGGKYICLTFSVWG